MEAGGGDVYVLHWMDAPKFLGSLLSLYSIHYSSNRTKNKKEPMRSSLSLSFLSLLLFNMLYYLNSGAVFMTNHCTGSIGTKSMAFSLASSDQVTFLGASIPLPFPPQWPLPSSQEYLWVSLPEGERGVTFRARSMGGGGSLKMGCSSLKPLLPRRRLSIPRPLQGRQRKEEEEEA